MPLLSFWRTNKQEVLKLSVEQVVSSAGDGALRDSEESSSELREFLKEVNSERLFDYAGHCLESSFPRSGFVLQDVVNEFGRRLGFEVENGLYQGKSTAVGFDGIWRSHEADLIVEVKTTDSYTISLDKLAVYRNKLIESKRVSATASTLIVVGREDTGALEAQVRGSRFAWDMRLIGIERLIKLVQIKEKSDEPTTLRQVQQLLQPFEYTKVDRIIDVIFTTAEDVENQVDLTEPVASSEEVTGVLSQDRTGRAALDLKRQDVLNSFGKFKGKVLIKHSQTLFRSPDDLLRVCCAVSKRYESDYQPYWYAFHPKWDEFLGESAGSFMILSCMDRQEAYAIPYSWLVENKKHLNTTDRGEKSYWHIALTTLSDGDLGWLHDDTDQRHTDQSCRRDDSAGAAGGALSADRKEIAWQTDLFLNSSRRVKLPHLSPLRPAGDEIEGHPPGFSLAQSRPSQKRRLAWATRPELCRTRYLLLESEGRRRHPYCIE